jgi:hypothetical protein
MADFGAFGADGGGGCSFAAGSATIPAAGSVLGADYYPGDHAVIAGCGIQRFLAAFRRDGAWSSRGRDCGESFRAGCACLRCLRVHPGIAPRRGSIGSACISVRGRYPGDCVVGAAGDGSCMANRLSSVRRSVHRNWGGANLGVGVAGEGSHTIGEKLNSSFIPSEKDGPLAKKNIAELFVDVLAEAGVRQIYGGFS